MTAPRPNPAWASLLASDPETEPFWAAARQHTFVVRHCNACGRHHFYPRHACPHCWSDNCEWRPVSGAGRVFSYTVIHHNDHAAFRERVPYVVALIDLVEGRSAGDKFDVVVSPEEGYGTPNEMLIQVVPREAFQGVDELEVGMQFQAQTPQGAISVVIASIEDGMVTVDGNHPLAGQTLHFAIEVTEVREASVEEVLHGHVHGAGGHHH